MKKITEQLQEIIAEEGKKNSNDNQFEKFEQILEDMKKSGYLKTPNYTLPLVDTIGKNYYSSINKKS